ncbi:MAG: zinc dependent phospholipase C family protein [Lachnospiraceae bacterium]|nr:zinc dependent phospholipase C family protein [Lachnospiraceae bacterium]
MPGFITHYLFGCETVKNIKEKNLRNVIRENKKAFSLGLQGPDVFFYFPYSFTGNKKRLASVMHVYDTGRFLHNLIEEVNGLNDSKKNIGLAYLLGFLGHYSMDTKCHPYIYYRTGYLNKGKDYFGKHTDFETDIDFLLLDKLKGKSVVDFRQENTIKLDAYSTKIIAKILNNACNKTYPYIKSSNKLMEISITSFYYSNGMLNDKNGYKKRALAMAEKIVLGSVSAAPLFMVANKDMVWDDPLNEKKAEWKNPWDLKHKSRKSFLELMDEAQSYYITLINNVGNEIIKNADIDFDLLDSLICNNSYHSGLDCSIPS